MGIKIAYSINPAPNQATLELAKEFANFDPKLLIYFASSNIKQAALGQEIKNSFPDTDVIGCSTAGEIISGQMLKNSVVAMAFDAETIADLKIEVIKNINDHEEILRAFASFANYFGKGMDELEYDQYVGLIFMDGLSTAEEKVMEKIGMLTNVNFIGGSAGDDLKFTQTYVCANGETLTNAAVLALLKPCREFSFIKTQSFNILKQKLTATKVNEAERTVLEFNHQKATEAYAAALGVTPHKIADYFMRHPLGIVINEKTNDVFVRSPQRTQDGCIIFYCNINEGMDVNILESTDIVQDTTQALQDKIAEWGDIAGIINFNCILRTLELENKQQTEAYAHIFKDIPTIGFSTYGEAFMGHINQTATMLVFK